MSFSRLYNKFESVVISTNPDSVIGFKLYVKTLLFKTKDSPQNRFIFRSTGIVCYGQFIWCSGFRTSMYIALWRMPCQYLPFTCLLNGIIVSLFVLLRNGIFHKYAYLIRYIFGILKYFICLCGFPPRRRAIKICGLNLLDVRDYILYTYFHFLYTIIRYTHNNENDIL